MKYITISTSNPYQAEIYNNCYATVSVRQDGERARIIYDTTEWHGNTGGYVRKTEYYTGRAAVRKMMRSLRRNQISNIKMGGGRDHSSSILNIVNPRY